MTLILKALRLTSRPTTQVVEVGGFKFNVTVEKDPTRKPRLFVVADLEDANNPFAPMRSRAITQQYNSVTGEPIWRIPIDRLIQAVSKEVPGEFMTAETEPYVIREGVRPASSYTAAVFPHETMQSVFHNAGRRLKGEPMDVLPPRFQVASVSGAPVILNEDELTQKAEVATSGTGINS